MLVATSGPVLPLPSPERFTTNQHSKVTPASPPRTIRTRMVFTLVGNLQSRAYPCYTFQRAPMCTNFHAHDQAPHLSLARLIPARCHEIYAPRTHMFTQHFLNDPDRCRFTLIDSLEFDLTRFDSLAGMDAPTRLDSGDTSAVVRPDRSNAPTESESDTESLADAERHNPRQAAG